MAVNGEALRKAREAKGLSRSALARLLNLSPQAIEKWENGKSEPTPANARRLSEVLASDPPVDELSQLRAVVEAQAQVVLLLAREARGRMGADGELAERLAALEVVLGLRRLP